MSKCPHCKEEIDYLNVDIKAIATIDIKNTDTNPVDSSPYFLSYFFKDTARFICPECNKRITNKQFNKLKEARHE